MRRLHAPIQGLLLDELGQEACGGRGAIRGNSQQTATRNGAKHSKHAYMFKIECNQFRISMITFFCI